MRDFDRILLEDAVGEGLFTQRQAEASEMPADAVRYICMLATSVFLYFLHQ